MQVPPALRSREFAWFWTGLVLSALGSQFTQIAMLWQMYELTGSPLQTGLLGLARAIPQMSLILLGGLLADAIDRRKLLVVTQLGQLAVSATLTALTFANSITPEALYIASAALALFTALENPARTSIVPNLVPAEHLTSAMALNSSQRQIGTIVGPSVAGVLLATSGAMPCYLVDSLSWLVMLAVLLNLRAGAQTGARRGSVSARALVDGLVFVRSNPILLWIMAIDFGANLFGTNRGLLPVYAKDILDVGAQGLGLMFAATSVGGLVAGAVMSMLPPVRRAGLWMLIGVVVYGICLCGFAVSTSFWLSLVMLAGTGAGNGVSAALRGALTQLSTPDRLRGRVASVNALFSNGGPQLGQMEAGLVAELTSTPFSALSGSLATLAVAVGAFCVPLVRKFEAPVDPLEPPSKSPASVAAGVREPSPGS